MSTERLLELALQALEHGDAPEPCAEAADLYAKLGQWHEAANMWGRARAASIGMTRRARYELAQARCEVKYMGMMKHHIQLLVDRIPSKAENIAVVGAYAFFNMPRGWVPSAESSITNGDSDSMGRQWKVSL